ncbi:thiol-disulfide oxidoreductase DCC family protein [Maribellus maritimus]|uniref:thiol-disulfide oxidoreductase DCC family protein n=1 Tax=Maribellus maritimus TaxID=2870838 RepID=UPI001EEB7541|nr:DCC1-like thiol-disulfide oxidoreductase family protein [Maribellus maritimus]MCG6188397.1 DCC1-like thiol-disulfide oxidoreductase family protein [Maribellus maritimus]
MMKYPLIIFDGVCNLCNGAVDFVLSRDYQKQFRFVTLQSEAGEKVLRELQIPAETDSVILYWKKELFTESEAALEIVRLLPAPWKWAVVFKFIPKKPRDKIYRWIAKNRYRWFGQKQTCRLPSPQEKQFFPEADDLKF